MIERTNNDVNNNQKIFGMHLEGLNNYLSNPNPITWNGIVNKEKKRKGFEDQSLKF